MRHLYIAATLLVCACVSAPVSAQAPRRALDGEFQRALEETIASDPNIPVALAVVRAPRMGINFSGAVPGSRESGSGAPLTERPFRIASVTKVFTAAAIFRLVEQDLVDLDAPIARYIPAETRAALAADGYDPEAITVTHLLGHASGIPDHADETYLQAVLVDPQHRWTPQEQIAFGMEHGDPLGAPGAAFNYSDTGYVILGQIIVERTGQPYAAAIRRLLGFDRLGLRLTWYETLEPAPTAAPPLRQFIGDIETTNFDASLDLWGGGGVITTGDDLAVFMRALFRGEVFERPETLAAALAVPVIEDQASGDAHNLIMFRQPFGRRSCYGHSGFWGVLAVYCPADDITVVVTVNNAAGGQALFGLLNRVAAVIESVD